MHLILFLYFFAILCYNSASSNKGVSLKMRKTDAFSLKVFFHNTKTSRLIKGFIFAFVFFGLLTSFAFFVQTKWFPVKNVREYLVNTNYISDNKTRYVQIEPKEDQIFFEFLIPESEKDSRILLFDLANNRVDIFINGEKMLFQDAKFSLKPNGTLLSYHSEKTLFPIKLLIVVNPGGSLIMEDFPLIGKESNLSVNAELKSVFNNFIYILVAGMGLLLAFIFIPIAFKDSEKLKSFLPVGIVMLYYGIFVFLVHFFFGGYTFYTNRVDTWANIIPGYLASNLLFAGLENYFCNSWKMAKILFLSNICLFPFLFFFPVISTLIIIIINLSLFSILAYRSDMFLFNFLVFTSFASELFSLFVVSFFPYWQMDLDGISMFVLLFGIGYFFILDFNKQNELLQIQSSELQVTNEQMYAMNEVLKDEYMEIEKINNSLEETIKERTSQLRQSIKSIETLLNNTGEGFLKFNDSLLVEEGYSAECKKIFCKKIDYHFFPVLISNGETSSMEMTAKVLRWLLNEEDPGQREMLFSLLPTVIENCYKVLSLKYRLIEEEVEENHFQKKIMVIINDITKELSLKNKIKEEKEIFEDIIRIIAHYDEFQSLVDEYLFFWEKESLNLPNRSELPSEEKRNELFRQVHTFKGNFSSYGMKTICESLHMLESQMEEKNQDLNELFKKIRVNQFYLDWLEKDMKKVYQQIDQSILEKQKHYHSERQQIKQALELLQKVKETDELREAKQILHKLQLKPFREAFASYKLLFESTARRFGVLIEDIEITGTDVLINSERLKPLFRSWVHILRNMYDHGIESPEERTKKGKPENGKIMIEAKEEKGTILFKIFDDGRGIDLQAVSKKALEKGLITPEVIQQSSAEDLFQLIFQNGFSTKTISNEISGRGMGLASVKEEVEKLSGTITVKSEKDKGTAFLIEIPKNDILYSA